MNINCGTSSASNYNQTFATAAAQIQQVQELRGPMGRINRVLAQILQVQVEAHIEAHVGAHVAPVESAPGDIDEAVTPLSAESALPVPRQDMEEAFAQASAESALPVPRQDMEEAFAQASAESALLVPRQDMEKAFAQASAESALPVPRQDMEEAFAQASAESALPVPRQDMEEAFAQASAESASPVTRIEEAPVPPPAADPVYEEFYAAPRIREEAVPIAAISSSAVSAIQAAEIPSEPHSIDDFFMAILNGIRAKTQPESEPILDLSPESAKRIVSLLQVDKTVIDEAIKDAGDIAEDAVQLEYPKYAPWVAQMLSKDPEHLERLTSIEKYTYHFWASHGREVSSEVTNHYVLKLTTMMIRRQFAGEHQWLSAVRKEFEKILKENLERFQAEALATNGSKCSVM